MTSTLLFPLYLGSLLAGMISSCAPPGAPRETPVSEAGVIQPSADSLPPFDKAYLTGRFDPERHPDFSPIAAPFSSRAQMYMRTDAYLAFQEMHAAALKEGIKLTIVSAARNFDRQKTIWEAKWRGQTLVEGGINLARAEPDPIARSLRILRFSSMPGTSRHHWGTDIDLNALEDSWFLEGEGKRIYAWLRAHAHEYGFCQPYSPKGPDRPEGYEEEKWHWSYMPVSRVLTALAEEQLRDEDIAGFEGASTATGIQVVRHFVLGISPECR